MSDTYLRLIPADRWSRPAEADAERARQLLSSALPEADKVSVETHPHPVFVDQGVNLEAVLCPRCQGRLSLYRVDEADSNREWWYRLVDPLEDQSVADVVVNMPCCSAAVPFHQLEFDWPAGVASFELSARNPGVGRPLDDGVLKALEGVLGTAILEVWAHY